MDKTTSACPQETTHQQPRHTLSKNPLAKAAYFCLAFLTLGLAILGIVLPLLPTTPFLLITLFAFAKSSERFYRWFIRTWLYKRFLKTYAETGAMKKKHKWRILLFVDLMLLITFIRFDILWMRILIIVLALIKYWYFFTQIGTLEEEKGPQI